MPNEQKPRRRRTKRLTGNLGPGLKATARKFTLRANHQIRIGNLIIRGKGVLHFPGTPNDSVRCETIGETLRLDAAHEHFPE